MTGGSDKLSDEVRAFIDAATSGGHVPVNPDALPLSLMFGADPEPPRRRGRPLKAATVALREAVLALPERHEQMTVRGIFYALSSEGVVPKTESGYNRVKRQVLKLRRENLLPWSFVADGTRWVRQATTFDSGEEALRDIARLYRRDLWRSQDVRVEVWLEKDALADLIYPIVDKWGAPLMVTRGVSSATFVYNAAQEAEAWFREDGRSTILLCFFDYDAGGERAFRSIVKSMGEFAPESAPQVERIALTGEQIEEWGVPTRPAKRSDPEAAKWGDRPAAELDAIDPEILKAQVDAHIRRYVDEGAWKVAETYEREEREGLKRLAAHSMVEGGIVDLVEALEDGDRGDEG